jgi:hypothetical protein
MHFLGLRTARRGAASVAKRCYQYRKRAARPAVERLT